MYNDPEYLKYQFKSIIESGVDEESVTYIDECNINQEYIEEFGAKSKTIGLLAASSIGSKVLGTGTIAGGAASGIFGIAGIGYGIYRYFTSVKKRRESVDKLKSKISSASSNEEKSRLTNELKKAESNLQKSIDRATKEKAGLIEKTKKLDQDIKSRKSKLSSMSESEKEKLDKDIKKLEARKKILSKLEINI